MSRCLLTPKECEEQFRNYAESQLPSVDIDGQRAHVFRFCADFIREFCLPDVGDVPHFYPNHERKPIKTLFSDRSLEPIE